MHMKNLAKDFLTTEEQEQISRCVQETEKTTSGEIVPMVVSASYHYPMASLLGALIVSLLLAAGLTIAESIRRAWGGLTMFDLWLFPAAFAVALLLLHELLKAVPALKRLFITAAEIAEEVEEAALTAFYRQGLGATRDRTGILIYISVFERRAYVLADQGISEKIKPETWQEVVELVTRGFRQKRHAEAICQAVRRCGELLREHFPVKPDDTNELKNLIVEG
jgi:putative membrane protein